MNTIYKKLSLLAFAVFALLSTSCSDFLETTPYDFAAP